jgi:SAM-dependent methyltransferase
VQTDTLVEDTGFEQNIEDQLFDKTEREKWQNPALVLRKLGNIENKKIADIGSGTGYFTFPLALRAKKVIAIDIDPEFLDYIEKQKSDYPPKIANAIETRLTGEADPNIRAEEVDIAFMVNVYSYLQNRTDYLAKVKEGIKKGGFILIVDFKIGDLPIGPSEDLKIAPEKVEKELQQAGFTKIEIDMQSLAHQYIIKAHK